MKKAITLLILLSVTLCCLKLTINNNVSFENSWETFDANLWQIAVGIDGRIWALDSSGFISSRMGVDGVPE